MSVTLFTVIMTAGVVLAGLWLIVTNFNGGHTSDERPRKPKD